MWPNFFIVGASKSGTTSLYEYLNKIKGIYMSRVKEPHYFQRNSSESIALCITDKAEYLKLFKSASKEQMIGEASTSYLRDPESAKLIHDEVHDAKIIIMLRDPCERIFSGYLMFKSQGIEKKPFHQLITTNPSFLESGLYYSQVKRYLDIFSQKQVKIFVFEEFIQNPKRTISKILEFLNVDSKIPEVFEKIHNPYTVSRSKISQKILSNKIILKISNQIMSKSFKSTLKEAVVFKKGEKPDIPKETRLILENYYRNDMKKLQNLLKRKFPWDWIEKN